MSVWGYIRGHLVSLVIAVLTCAALWAMLRLVGQGADLAALFTMVVALAFAVSGLANYLHERSLYRRLLPIVSGGSDTLGLAAELRDPGTPLGDMACEAVRTVRAQAQVQVGEACARERDHREFVEVWVHEVKTPLAAAELMVENLGDSRLRPLSHELDRVTAYVEQALFYARSSSVENDYLVRSCMLADLVGAAAKDRASATVRAGVALGMEGLDLQVFTDPKWIKFVLGQIIDNAVRYRRSLGPVSTLRDTSRTRGRPMSAWCLTCATTAAASVPPTLAACSTRVLPARTAGHSHVRPASDSIWCARYARRWASPCLSQASRAHGPA